MRRRRNAGDKERSIYMNSLYSFIPDTDIEIKIDSLEKIDE